MLDTELRLGNLVGCLNDINEPAKICYINEDSLGFERLSDGEYFQGNSGVPIPLTEEWLLKFGFERDKEYLDDYIFRLKTETGEIVLYSKKFILSSTDTLCELKYVHQLQNLYFCLTQKELILNK